MATSLGRERLDARPAAVDRLGAVDAGLLAHRGELDGLDAAVVGRDLAAHVALAFEPVHHHRDEAGVTAPPVGQLPHRHGLVGLELQQALEHGRRQAELLRGAHELGLVLGREEQLVHRADDHAGCFLSVHDHVTDVTYLLR